MKISDIVLLAVNNLKLNTMRTVLTSLGVAVGIGSLASMISFGQGVSGNVSKSMETNDIFTGLTVSSRDIDYQNYGRGKNSISISDVPIVPLNDSSLTEMRSWPDVAIAFPEVVKQGTVVLGDKAVQANVKGVPTAMADMSPFSGISRGRFFQNDDEASVIVSKSLLDQMEIDLSKDSVLGCDLEIVTKVFDFDKLNSGISSLGDLPIKNESSFFKIVGVVETNSFTAGMFSGGVFMPSNSIEYIPSINLQNVYDIMDGKSGKYGKYNSVHIRVREHHMLKSVKTRLEQMGFQVFSIGDKLDDIEKIFVMLDSILAAIGSIALLVAVLGIVNTLMMAIYERRKEIGIMKSLGGTQSQIKMIFYFEAAIIGFIGGLVGILGGTLASTAASSIANSQIGKLIDCDIEYFDFSWWLIVGSVLFSVLISVLASIYPANKAALIDPLDALRRE